MIGKWITWPPSIRYCTLNCGRRRGGDKLWWILSRRGIFYVRSFYKILVHKDNPSFPWKSIWQTKAPLKVALLAWSAALENILTLDNLRKRHLIMVNRCAVCVNWTRNPLIISSSFVRLLAPYGMPSSVVLGFPGLCLIVLRICSPIGGQGVTLRALPFGKWCLFFLCGAYGGKEMIRTSIIKRGP